MLFIIVICITSVLSLNNSIEFGYSNDFKLGSGIYIHCFFKNISVFSDTDQLIWKKNSKIISVNGEIIEPFNKEKYFILELKQKSSLIIHKTTIDDFESKYTCSFNDETITRKIIINEQIFMNIPTEKEISINDLNSTINIHIKKIYPIPKCNFKINNNIFNIENKNTKKLNKYYYETFLEFSNNFTECDTILTVTCTVLTENITIFTKKLTDCSKSSNLNFSKIFNLIPELITFFSITISLFIIFVIYIIINNIIKKQKNNPDIFL